MSAASPLQTGSARRVEVAGLAALQAGLHGSAPALLVPGFTGSKEDFGPILDPLADAGYLVTAVDLPGQYESPPPASGDYAPDALAVSVLAAADALGGGVRLLGHSYGGLVARAAVLARPAAFASLVLLCSGPARIGDERRALLELLEPVLDGSGVPGVYAASEAVDAAAPGFLPPPPDVAAFLRRRFLAGTADMLRGMSTALRTEPDRVDDLAATGVPVLVAHGVDDVPWPPAQQREMAARLGARYTVLPDAAHSPAVENPAATVAALTDFWRC